MKNTLTDLNNYLFESIERLNDDDLSDEELEREIKRSDAVQKVAKIIIDNGALALQAQKHFDEYGIDNKVEMPLLGVTDKNLIEENKNLRERIKKTEQW
jgi:putative N-acetylmannosamine-6-phosphate epimerase